MGTTNNRGRSNKPSANRSVKSSSGSTKRVVRTTSNQQKTDKYVKKSDSSSKKQKKKPASKGAKAGKVIVFSIGKFILTLFLILIITGCVVATAMTVFVMKYVDSGTTLDLDNVKSGYTGNIYGLDANGEDVVVQSLTAEGRRTWVDIDQIPQHVQDAVVCTEDRRFREHEGVDWLRTFAAFANMITGDRLNFSGGASTITQQLIKNINGDFYDRSPSKKLKEILGALNLERNYTKSQILEAYMNYISLDNNVYGLQAGAEYYFGKDVSQLSIAEAAALASITKSPADYSPIDNPEENKRRRNWVIDLMLEDGHITQEQHAAAIAEELVLVDRTLITDDSGAQEKGIYNWYVDTVIREVQEDLVEQYGYTSEEALAKINGQGLQIYTPMDIAMQDKLERLFLDDNNFYSSVVEDHPEAAMVIMDYNGNIKAQVGSRDPKEDNLGFNFIVQGIRSQGSCMKPITAYAPALQQDLIYWSKIGIDEPKYVENGVPGPNNYDKTYTGPVTMINALKKSLNTIPVELVQQMGYVETYNYLHDTLGLSNFTNPDSAGLGITLGFSGVYLNQFTATYTMFGNGGFYSSPKTYTKVLDNTGKVILETDQSQTQVLDTDTAYIMNRMLREVVTSGTGTQANMDQIEVVGKTGTGEDTDVSFVGCTPYYVASLWMGYEDNRDLPTSGVVYTPSRVWKNIMSSILEGYAPATFELDSTGVQKLTYCQDTGLIAGVNCPKVGTGYYKTSNAIPTCSGSHVVPQTDPAVPENTIADPAVTDPAAVPAA